jgi:hypothetical protein
VCVFAVFLHVSGYVQPMKADMTNASSNLFGSFEFARIHLLDNVPAEDSNIIYSCILWLLKECGIYAVRFHSFGSDSAAANIVGDTLSALLFFFW